ncbi:MAG: TolC family protein [Phycisphaerae bacterium]|nr:TolC family protein [Phycisphaerae bacterium]
MAGLVTLTPLAGCGSLATVDRDTNAALHRSAEHVGDLASLPRYDPARYTEGQAFPKATPNLESPTTVNPPLEALDVQSRSAAGSTAEEVIARFNAMVEIGGDAPVLTFENALAYAQQNAPEYLTAEETYIITALQLLIEEHRWGPNFFNETSAFISADADNTGRYNTALNLLNDFGVTQRLPYGGQVSARVLVEATEQLDDAFDGESQSASILLGANIPLLRGAGLTAREPLIQSRRNLIYAAREFQTFRRSFYVDLARNYLQLIFQQQQIDNAERQVRSSREVEDLTVALVDSGRTEPFQADLARQNTLFAIDRLAQLKENYRLAVDTFKLRIGMDTTASITIDRTAIDLPIPAATLDEAVRLALEFRLDLQTEADQVDDFERKLNVAKNDLQGDLNLALNADIPTDSDKVRSGLQFRPRSTDFVAGVTYSMPLDRTAEESIYRQSKIQLERQRRSYRTTRDSVAIQARQAVRSIETAQFSLVISARNVEASENRENAIDAAPDRATARDRTEAVNNLNSAQDSLQQAKRDLQIAILSYLETTGQLRVTPGGNLALPPGLAGAPSNAPAGP